MIKVFLYPFSLLPLAVLYLFSDLAFFILYRLLAYRKNVVLDNLQQAFPEKNSQEINKICKVFYKGFCDQWVETVKLLSISEKALNKRITGNWELFDRLPAGKNCYALVGHMFNWEWLNVAWQYNIKQQYACYYSPVSNQGFDKLMYDIRTKSGAVLISNKSRKGIQVIQPGPFVLGLAADQTPSDLKNSLWFPFMHREVPFFKGPEKMARRADGAVVFTSINKLSRGRYKVHFELITENASGLPEGELTAQYVSFLERQLRRQPSNWLWSHRRWKHARTSELAEV